MIVAPRAVGSEYDLSGFGGLFGGSSENRIRFCNVFQNIALAFRSRPWDHLPIRQTPPKAGITAEIRQKNGTGEPASVHPNSSIAAWTLRQAPTDERSSGRWLCRFGNLAERRFLKVWHANAVGGAHPTPAPPRREGGPSWSSADNRKPHRPERPHLGQSSIRIVNITISLYVNIKNQLLRLRRRRSVNGEIR